MKTHATTYDLIIASESQDRVRSVAETLISAVLILSAVVSIIAAAAQPVVAPSRVTMKNCATERCA